MSRKLRFASLVTLAVTVAATLWTGTGASGAVVSSKLTGLDEPGRIGGSYLVALKPGVVPEASLTGLRSAARSLTSRSVGRVAGTLTQSPAFIFEGSLAQAKRLAAEPSVRGVEADRKVPLADVLSGPTTGGTRLMRANHPGAANDAFDAGFTGSGVNIGIIDTGVDLNHAEFAGRIFSQTPTFGATTDGGPNTAICRRKSGAEIVEVGSGLSPDGRHRYGDDKNGHGTRTAGNAAAGGVQIFGVAPAATLVVARTALRVSSVARCIDYMTSLNNDLNPLNDVPIVNISLAYRTKGVFDACDGSQTAVTPLAICALSNSLDGTVPPGEPNTGVFISAAAGNNGTDAKNTAPGKYTQVASVSALCDAKHGPTASTANVGEHTAGDGICGFSNSGLTVDFIAPGGAGGPTDVTKGVASLKPGVFGGAGGTCCVYSAGTSRAAPHIAGLAALLVQMNPLHTAAQMRTFMQNGGFCADGLINNLGGSCDSTGTNQGEWRRIRYSDFLDVGADRDAALAHSAEPFPVALCTLQAAGAVIPAAVAYCV